MKEPNVSVAIMSGNKIAFELHGDFECSCNRKRCSGKYIAKYENETISITDGSEIYEIDLFRLHKL